jgi:hypothetical protein
VLRAGRIGGQFAKPRSRATERVGNRELPSYRGHLVNGPEPDPEARRPDSPRLLTGYMAAGDIMEHLGWRGSAHRQTGQARIWTSHEALILDYELPMIRQEHDGGLYLTSAHWPWIGERTRQVEGAHVALLAQVSNPVACKVGPAMEPGELLALFERLDPWRTPGRLTPHRTDGGRRRHRPAAAPRRGRTPRGPPRRLAHRSDARQHHHRTQRPQDAARGDHLPRSRALRRGRAPLPLPAEGDLPPAAVPWKAEPDRSVLLVHDMQRYFVTRFPTPCARS